MKTTSALFSLVLPDVARVAEGREQVLNKAEVFFIRMSLFDEDHFAAPVPLPRPVLVGPAEAERKVRRSGREHFLERALEKAPALKPIMVIAEAVNAVFSGEPGLRFTNLAKAKVVNTKISRQVGLIVFRKSRACAGY